MTESKMPLIVSYHTPFEVYVNCARKLEASLKQFDLRYDINCLPSKGDWYKNCCQKAEYVRSMLDKHPNENIIWMDADMDVKSYPYLLEDISEDTACPVWEDNRVMSCLIYFKNCDKVKSFVDSWIELSWQNCYHFVTDQYGFSLALKKHKEVSMLPLPDSYAYIVNCVRDYPYVNGTPIIIADTISNTINRIIPE